MDFLTLQAKHRYVSLLNKEVHPCNRECHNKYKYFPSPNGIMEILSQLRRKGCLLTIRLGHRVEFINLDKGQNSNQ